RSRIDHDRVRHFERGVMLFAADQLDGIHQFFRIGIVEQKREALDRLVRQSAAARFFPRQVLVKKIDLMARASELLTAHCAGRSAADDCYLGHSCVSLSAINSVPARGTPAVSSFGGS